MDNRRGNVQLVIQRFCLTSHQKVEKANTITEQYLKDKETQSPGTHTIVHQVPQQWKPFMAMFPVARCAVLVDGHEDCHSPSPPFKPMKELGIRSIETTAISVGNNICCQHGTKPSIKKILDGVGVKVYLLVACNSLGTRLKTYLS